MPRLSRLAALLAVAAAVGGCATYRVQQPAPQAPVTSSSGAPVLSSSGPVTSSAPAPAVQAGLRPGYGVVESISLVNPPSASTGGPAVVSAPYRLTVRMDDNTVQWMDVTDRDYRVGDRLQISADNRILKM